jgi:hypothetical protein
MKTSTQVIALILTLVLPSTVPGYVLVDSPSATPVHLRVIGGRRTAVVKGHGGGESHVTYSLDLHGGDDVVVRIASRGNRASFVVSREDFGEPVTFGAESEEGRVWKGTMLETGTYYISVVAHPEPRYTLRFTVCPLNDA